MSRDRGCSCRKLVPHFPFRFNIFFIYTSRVIQLRREGKGGGNAIIIIIIISAMCCSLQRGFCELFFFLLMKTANTQFSPVENWGCRTKNIYKTDWPRLLRLVDRDLNDTTHNTTPPLCLAVSHHGVGRMHGETSWTRRWQTVPSLYHIQEKIINK